MFRNRWTATVLVAVISAAQAVPQTMTPSPVPTSSQIITVKEPGKPDQRCRILKSWVEPDGSVAFEVQALDTGEKMTIVQASDAVPLKNGTRPGKEMVQAMRSRIYHWIRNTVPPPGAPLAPPVVEETIVSSPQVPAPVIVKEPSRIRPIVKPAPVVVERRPRLRPVVTPPVVAKKAKPEGSEDKAEGGLLRKSLQSLFTKRPSSKPQPMKLPRVFKQELTPKKADSAPSSQTAQKPLNYSREPVRRVAQTPKTAPPKAKVGSTSISLEKNKADDKQQADKGKNTDKSGQGPSLLTSDVPPPADAKEKQPEPKIEAAKPTDWHQSWGKTDDHKTELPKARSEKDDPLEDPTKFVKWPQLEPKEDKKPDAVEDKTKSDVASKSADGKEAKADPKEEYKKNLKAAENAKATDQPTGFRAILAKILSKDKRPSAPTGKEPASDVPIPNPYAGAKSVLSATSPGGQVVYVPVPVVTVPQRTAPQPPYPPAMPPQSAPQLVPPPRYPQRMPQAVPPITPENSSQMLNAFTTAADYNQVHGMDTAFYQMNQPPIGAPRRMSPPLPHPMSMQMGQPPMVAPIVPPAAYPNRPPMVHPAARMPMAYRSVAQTPTPAPYAQVTNSQSPAGFDVQQMLVMMRNSLYPSHREWAAKQLATLDWQQNPIVVEALVQAATNDPAPTVRAECARCLGKMNVNTLSIVQALQKLKQDKDPRVIQAAHETLVKFGVEKASDPVFPADHRTLDEK